jgi:DNA polymerase III epsilon subunit family exonuclease
MDGFFDFIELRVDEKRLSDVKIFGLDLETTGLDVNANEITEIGIAEYELTTREISPVYQSLVRPEQEIQDFITKITGIRNEDVLHAPDISIIVQECLPIIEHGVLVVHNADFDIGFLKKFIGEGFLQEYDIAVFDTLKMSRRLLDHSRYSLEYLVESLGLGHEQHHRAMDDARMCIKLFDHLVYAHQERFSHTISHILQSFT